jgi:hypothetical protein
MAAEQVVPVVAPEPLVNKNTSPQEPLHGLVQLA